MFALCVWGLVLVTRAESAAQDDAKEAFKPVASLDSLMRGQEQQFEALKTLLGDTNARGRTAGLVRAAELLAELANVNHQHAEKRADYNEWTIKMRTLALDIAGEAKKRQNADDTKMKTLLGEIEATCNACHNVYQ
jgi:cytochrome c556